MISYEVQKYYDAYLELYQQEFKQVEFWTSRKRQAEDSDYINFCDGKIKEHESRMANYYSELEKMEG